MISFIIEIGQKVRYLNEIGTVRRDGWIEYHNQSLNSMPAFVDEAPEFLSLSFHCR